MRVLSIRRYGRLRIRNCGNKKAVLHQDGSVATPADGGPRFLFLGISPKHIPRLRLVKSGKPPWVPVLGWHPGATAGGS